MIEARPVATPRLDLLPLRTADAAEMARVLGDPALHTFIGGEPYSEDALRARYRRLVAGSPDPAVSWLNWVVRLRAEDCLTGTVQATVDHAARVAEIAWVVGTPWQGRGIAGEAARALADALAGGTVAGPLEAVVAHVHPEHAASAAVARSAGLSPTGVWQDGEIRWRRLPPPG
ncbi:GNAT family N-acetyltransferase [Streptomyces sp. SID5785]|uniref:GNAT family N-acetyltransferase n=1 Tax=Streptomyces sp. SID5785 TaxID=2690309 RepID=UPI001361C800|nr:GNAT family N-acetyltransferase [Streptomyces sp. SID5785]MZD08512.1 GNAT family N-acetyltransferase [Streptomyces sp. SID5785]